MKPQIIALENSTPAEQKLVYKLLAAGEVIAYPTDTIYGLGVDIYHPMAVAKLQRLKGRDYRKPISILYPSVERLLADFEHLSPFQMSAVRKLMPGMVTLVLPVQRENQFPAPFVSRGLIGTRVANLPALNRLLADYPHPLSTTSINPAGAKPANSITEIKRYFGSDIALLIDNGMGLSERSSTIIKLTGNRWKIIRQGIIPAAQVEESLGNL